MARSDPSRQNMGRNLIASGNMTASVTEGEKKRETVFVRKTPRLFAILLALDFFEQLLA
jgi:hypothetical protein